MPSLCVVAGDPSGDAHAANLIAALKRLDGSLTCSGLGGPRLREAGVELLDELTQTAAIGPFDAAKHLRRFARARATFQQHLATTHPHLVVLVDFGDFNLPAIAPLAKRAGCRVVYYISPQIWAWGRFRLRWVRRYVDRMIVLFKFEEAFYRREGIPVTWVGHPLLDTHAAVPSREETQRALGLNPWRMTVGLLPGSREHEVGRLAPLLAATARRIAWHMPGVQFLIPKAPGVSSQALASFQRSQPDLSVIVTENRMAECLS